MLATEKYSRDIAVFFVDVSITRHILSSVFSGIEKCHSLSSEFVMVLSPRIASQPGYFLKYP